MRSALSPIEEIVDEARNGRMVILVDDEERENEGDLVIPGQMATPDAINFMATHGRGLICLALTRGRCEHLGLELMSRQNGTRHETAFTVSIEAREDVTTGISAGDRARTVSVAIDASKGRNEITTPGHVFPLIGQDGGVLVRAGHTEAGIDIARLAGLNPSAVICEIMKDDGTMARLDDCLDFARKHRLKIGTIRDLIAYRRRYDHLVEQVGADEFHSDYGGDWKIQTFRNKIDGSVNFALIKGRVEPDRPVPCRVHVASITADLFGQTGHRNHLLQRSMAEIGREGVGVVLVLFQHETDPFRVTIGDMDGRGTDLRTYGIGAQILAELGVRDIVLLSNSERTVVALEGYGLNITGTRPIPEV